jgi:hypothetical protein
VGDKERGSKTLLYLPLSHSLRFVKQIVRPLEQHLEHPELKSRSVVRHAVNRYCDSSRTPHGLA